MEIFAKMAASYGLVGSFILVTVVMLAGYSLANLLHQKRMGAAFSILLALVVAWVGGLISHGQQAAYGAELITSVTHGITDVKFITQSGSALAVFGGIGILGGGMMRDYTIISTAWGVLATPLATGIPMSWPPSAPGCRPLWWGRSPARPLALGPMSSPFPSRQGWSSRWW